MMIPSGDFEPFFEGMRANSVSLVQGSALPATDSYLFGKDMTELDAAVLWIHLRNPGQSWKSYQDVYV